MSRIRLIILLICASLLLDSCAKPVKVSTTPPAKVVKPSEKADLGCSYFYYLWGANAEYFQRYEDALEAYDKALICDPEASYVRKKIPMVLIKQGENEGYGTLSHPGPYQDPRKQGG